MCFKNNIQLRVFFLECVKNGGREAKLEALGIFGVVGAGEVIFFKIIIALLYKFLLVVYICED